MKRIGEILIELGLTTEQTIQQAIEIKKAEGFKRRLGEILMNLKLREDDILKALSIQFSMPYINFEEYQNEFPINYPISLQFLKEHLLYPMSITDGVINVVIADPTDVEAVEDLKVSTGYAVKAYIGRKDDILIALENLYGSREAMMQRLIEDVKEEESDVEVSEEITHLREVAQEKGIVQIVNVIIENALKDRASDIHVEPLENTVRVRYRIDGVLYDKEDLPKRMQSAISSRIKLMSQMNIAERRLPQDGRIRDKFVGKDIDIRVSTLPTIYGESIVMRLLDRASTFFTLEELGFTPDLLGQYEGLIHKPYGMILMTGPTGSGKTTTLYASLAKINSPDKKIITIEEPVEYLLAGINQIQVRPKIGLTFASGLRHIVRQDPDVIMVGEIRDIETAGISIHAALTGHLLFSTLHTNDAPGAITRLLDMGVENYLASSTLIGIMAQRLVRRICPQCKISYKPEGDISQEFGITVNTLYKGMGCEYCNSTGYRGRLGIFELLIIRDEIRTLIMERATTKELKAKAISLGMRTLREDGLRKAIEGSTTIDEVLRVTQVEI